MGDLLEEYGIVDGGKKKPQKEEKKEEEPIEHKKEEKMHKEEHKPKHEKEYHIPPHKEGKEIVIRFNLTPQNMERLIFGVIILILLIMVLWNPFSTKCTSDINSPTGATIIVTDSNATTSTSLAATTTTTVATTTAVASTTSATTTIAAVTTTTLSGEISVTIDNVVWEVITRTDETKGAKLKEVKYTLTNQKKSFIPQIDVYAYDSDSASIHKTKARNSVTMNYALPTSSEPLVSSIMFSAQFPTISEKKTVKIAVIDSSTGIEEATAQKLITVS